jgi:predicted short-subunit dehydrogenase-like oxidoreductase (DUF2520 family)
VAEELGGTPVVVADDLRPLWHAAAVTAANGIAALLAAGESMLERCGISNPIDVLGPLAAGVVANAREGGGGAATLTGPVVRGDVAAVAAHLSALDRGASELRSAYALAAQLVLGEAARAGRIEPAAEGELRALLEVR